jgi:hypothetical protein
MGSVCDVLALPMPYRPKAGPASVRKADSNTCPATFRTEGTVP